MVVVSIKYYMVAANMAKNVGLTKTKMLILPRIPTGSTWWRGTFSIEYCNCHRPFGVHVIKPGMPYN